MKTYFFRLSFDNGTASGLFALNFILDQVINSCNSSMILYTSAMSFARTISSINFKVGFFTITLLFGELFDRIFMMTLSPLLA